MNATGGVRLLIAELERCWDAEYAAWCKNYLRGQFEFLGVPVPFQRKLMKEWAKRVDKPDSEQLRELVLSLWQLPEREYQRVAIDLLVMWRKQLTVDDVPWLEQLITSKSWWDTVDTIAPKIVGFLYVSDPGPMLDWLDEWNRSDNIWLQRTTVLFQLQAKTDTNEQLLYRYIGQLARSDEFFVQKAIGWALRQYARVQPNTVVAFVQACPLKPLSRREALKHIRNLTT